MTSSCAQCSTPTPAGQSLCERCLALRRGPAPGAEVEAGHDPAVAASVTPSPEGCRSCGGVPIEPHYALPLCTSCRDQLSRRPVPRTITVAASLVLLFLGFAFFEMPASLRAGVAYERAQRAEAAGNPAAAADNYAIVARQYPDSTLAVARLGLAAYRAKRYDQAADAFDKLGGREAPADLADQVNAAIGDLEKMSASPSASTPAK